MRRISAALAFSVLCISAAHATLFMEHSPSIWQPIANGPADGVLDEAPEWRYSPSYQRDIYVDFLSAGTIDVGYGGFLDSQLKSGDYWSYDPQGDIAWWGTFSPNCPGAEGQPGPRNGVIGVDARGTSYGTTRSGSIELHVNNVPDYDPGTLKNIWIEMEWLTNADSALAEVYLDRWGPSPPSYNVDFMPYDKETLGDGWYREHKYWQITPNPGWEDFQINFFARSGYFAALDNVHILTECAPVPEPSSIALLTLAVGGIGAVLKRRRKQ